ncbi:hypothetical protein ACFV2S_33475 [Streptomyces sp. NPDC059695]|uniref:hypothetical protein n=1 Tax=Streptomyces sp. NPDC059695 TaxID=3346910 RepID=UPI0036CC0F4D
MRSVTLALDWAATTSAVAAVAAVLATLIAGRWAYSAVVAKRTATFTAEITPMLSSSHSGLSVTLGADRLQNPHVASLFLDNVGRREIEVAAFNGEPIEFGFDSRIVSILTSDTTRNRMVPPATIRGNSLLIDPYVIHKKQMIVYKLLLDGADPAVSLRHNLSASLKECKPRDSERRIIWLSLGAVLGSLLLLGLAFFVLWKASQALELMRETQRKTQQMYESIENKQSGEGKQSSEPKSSPSVSEFPTSR